MNARRRDHDRRSYRGAEYGGGGIRVIHATQHVWDEAEALEGVAFRTEGDLVVRRAGVVGSGRRVHDLVRQAFVIVEVQWLWPLVAAPMHAYRPKPCLRCQSSSDSSGYSEK